MADPEVALRNWPTTLLTLEGIHDDIIHDAQFDYFGVRLATCSSDATVKVFEVHDGDYKLLQVLTAHEGPVRQVSWAHPSHGNMLASCSDDKTVIIWIEANGDWDHLYTCLYYAAPVNSVSWAPFQYGPILLCGIDDGTISLIRRSDEELWNIAKIDVAHDIRCHAVSWEPAGNPFLMPNNHCPDGTVSEEQVRRFASCGSDCLVKIWRMKGNTDDWEECAVLEGHNSSVLDVAWSPVLGFATTTIASCSRDGQVIIWTGEFHDDDKLDNDCEKEKWSMRVLNVFDTIVCNVSWSRNGNVLAVSDTNYKVSLWKETLNNDWVCFSEISRSLTALHNQREAERIAREEAERIAREEAERIAREEAERIAREEAEGQAEEKSNEEAERKTKEEAGGKTKEEAGGKTKEEAGGKTKEEAERKTNEEAEGKTKEEAEGKTKEAAEGKDKEAAGGLTDKERADFKNFCRMFNINVEPFKGNEDWYAYI